MPYHHKLVLMPLMRIQKTPIPRKMIDRELIFTTQYNGYPLKKWNSQWAEYSIFFKHYSDYPGKDNIIYY